MTYIQPQCYVIISEELDRRLRMFYKSERQGSFFLGEIIIAPGTSGHMKKNTEISCRGKCPNEPCCSSIVVTTVQTPNYIYQAGR